MSPRVSSRLVVAAALCTFASPAFSQPVITSFTTNGLLVCSQLAPDSIATVEWASSLDSEANWQDLQFGTVAQDGTVQVTVPVSQATAPRFYRIRGTGWPVNMALIPAGSFQMGDSLDGSSVALPVHTIYVSAIYMDRYEVTKALWDEVYTWATNHSYAFDNSYSGQGKASDHPAHSMTWYDAVKWCNARSEKENKIPAYYTDSGLSQRYRTGQEAPFVNWSTGYRLPTEAEWEKAARGGVSGRRFPWSDTDNITHSRANYYVYQSDYVYQSGDTNFYPYDVSPTSGYHQTFNDGVFPYTSPVGYFAPNDYGLYDMAGNVWEWCWDRYGSYASGTQTTDPRGPPSGSYRVPRGGGWYYYALHCRTAYRSNRYPTGRDYYLGFRTVLPPGQ